MTQLKCCIIAFSGMLGLVSCQNNPKEKANLDLVPENKNVNLDTAKVINASLNIAYLNAMFANEEQSVIDTTSSFPSIDFFSDARKIMGWSGPFSGGKSETHIKELPQLHFFDKEYGSARIICFPKYDLKEWIKIARESGDKVFDSVKFIAKDKDEQKIYHIYAFFMEYKDLVDLEERPSFPGEKAINFPAYIYIYKLENDKWKKLNKTYVTDWTPYADLQLRTILAKDD